MLCRPIFIARSRSSVEVAAYPFSQKTDIALSTAASRSNSFGLAMDGEWQIWTDLSRTESASKALDTSVRKLSCILCLCEDVRMASTRNDDRLDAQDLTCRRLLPLWPDLVVSRSRNVHVIDLRQRFQRTDFVEADHGMSG